MLFNNNQVSEDSLVNKILDKNGFIGSTQINMLRDICKMFNINLNADQALLRKKIKTKLADILLTERDNYSDYILLPRFNNYSAQTKKYLQDYLKQCWQQFESQLKNFQKKKIQQKVNEIIPQYKSAQQYEQYHLCLLNLIRNSSLNAKNQLASQYPYNFNPNIIQNGYRYPNPPLYQNPPFFMNFPYSQSQLSKNNYFPPKNFDMQITDKQQKELVQQFPPKFNEKFPQFQKKMPNMNNFSDSQKIPMMNTFSQFQHKMLSTQKYPQFQHKVPKMNEFLDLNQRLLKIENFQDFQQKITQMDKLSEIQHQKMSPYFTIKQSIHRNLGNVNLNKSQIQTQKYKQPTSQLNYNNSDILQNNLIQQQKQMGFNHFKICEQSRFLQCYCKGKQLYENFFECQKCKKLFHEKCLGIQKVTIAQIQCPGCSLQHTTLFTEITKVIETNWYQPSKYKQVWNYCIKSNQYSIMFESDDQYEIHIRFLKINGTNIGQIGNNSEGAKVNSIKLVKKFLGGFKNDVKIQGLIQRENIDTPDNDLYFFGLYLVRVKSPSQIIQNIISKDQNSVDKQYLLQILRKQLLSELILDFSDLLTEQNGIIPTRGKDCTHSQVFDLMSIIQTAYKNNRQSTILCPYCKKICQQFKIDTFINDIVSQLQQKNQYLVKLTVFASGKYEYQSKKNQIGDDEELEQEQQQIVVINKKNDNQKEQDQDDWGKSYEHKVKKLKKDINFSQ